MGARQSFQAEIDRRPRSNSTIETGVEVRGASARRPMPHYRHSQHGAFTEYDPDDGEELAGDFAASLANLGLAPAQPTEVGEDAAAAPGATASSAPSPSHTTHHRAHAHRGATTTTAAANSNSSGAGLRFSFRPSSRASFLQALTGISSSASGETAAAAAAVGNSRGRDIKCPMCHKKVPSDEVEMHLVMCFTRPRIAYNDDILENDKGECSICLDEMSAGDTIARLPCLCIYHKTCIDEWFKRKNCCPEHPGDE